VPIKKLYLFNNFGTRIFLDLSYIVRSANLDEIKVRTCSTLGPSQQANSLPQDHFQPIVRTLQNAKLKVLDIAGFKFSDDSFDQIVSGCLRVHSLAVTTPDAQVDALVTLLENPNAKLRDLKIYNKRWSPKFV
jgi:hypothetical protein